MITPPPIRVGLAGAGPWAATAYAPMLAAGPETVLTGVWSRTPERARDLAAAHGVTAAGTFAALLDGAEAIAFAVPPDVQAELAIQAAGAGRHLLLDKPLALTLPAARAVATAARSAGVVSQLMLTHRFRPSTGRFVAAAREAAPLGARLAFLSGAFLAGPYANAWRREHGALHDLGPHAFDLLEAAMGPIVGMRGMGDPRGWVSLACRHAGGAASAVALTGALPIEPSVFRLECHAPSGTLVFDGAAAREESPWPEARRRFAAAIRAGEACALDAAHGVRLQELIDEALRALAA